MIDQTHQILSAVSMAVTPFLVLAVGWFVSRTIGRLENDMRNVTNSNAEIKAEFYSFKRDLNTALIAAKHVDVLAEKVAVLQRNEKTMWGKIDDIKSDLNRIDKDFQKFGSLIHEFRKSIEIISEVKNGRKKTGNG